MCETGDLTENLSLWHLASFSSTEFSHWLSDSRSAEYPAKVFPGDCSRWVKVNHDHHHFLVYITILLAGMQLSWANGLPCQPSTCPGLSFSTFFISLEVLSDFTGMQTLAASPHTFLAWGTLAATSGVCHMESSRGLNVSQTSAKQQLLIFWYIGVFIRVDSGQPRKQMQVWPSVPEIAKVTHPPFLR